METIILIISLCVAFIILISLWDLYIDLVDEYPPLLPLTAIILIFILYLWNPLQKTNKKMIKKETNKAILYINPSDSTYINEIGCYMCDLGVDDNQDILHRGYSDKLSAGMLLEVVDGQNFDKSPFDAMSQWKNYKTGEVNLSDPMASFKTLVPDDQSYILIIKNPKKMSLELLKAEQQLIGFATASDGHSIEHLVESMGLTKKEWETLKKENRLPPMKKSDLEYAEKYFKQLK